MGRWMKQQHFDFSAFSILSFIFKAVACSWMSVVANSRNLICNTFTPWTTKKTHFWTSCETSTHYYDHLHNHILLTLFYLFIFSISKCTLTWIIKLNTFFFRNDGIGSFIALFTFVFNESLHIFVLVPNWYKNDLLI